MTSKQILNILNKLEKQPRNAKKLWSDLRNGVESNLWEEENKKVHKESQYKKVNKLLKHARDCKIPDSLIGSLTIKGKQWVTDCKTRILVLNSPVKLPETEKLEQYDLPKMFEYQKSFCDKKVKVPTLTDLRVHIQLKDLPKERVCYKFSEDSPIFRANQLLEILDILGENTEAYISSALGIEGRAVYLKSSVGEAVVMAMYYASVSSDCY